MPNPSHRDLMGQAERALFDQGLCTVGGPSNRCLKPIATDSEWGYCADHDKELAENTDA